MDSVCFTMVKSGWWVVSIFGLDVGEKCEKLAQNPVLCEYERNLFDAPIKSCQKSNFDSTTELQLFPLCIFELRTNSSSNMAE